MGLISKMLCAAVLGFGCLIGLTRHVSATVPVTAMGDDWELEFKPGPMRLYYDSISDESFWYFTYTVANRSQRDRMFAPKLELFTDDGEILRSGRGVPSRINRQLREMLADPLLEDQNRIIGELLVGRENARSGLAVWPDNTPNVTELTLFVAGLSSDSETIEHPVTKEPIRLQRTLRREYIVAGNPSGRGSLPVPLEPRKNRHGPECQNEFQLGGCWIYR